MTPHLPKRFPTMFLGHQVQTHKLTSDICSQNTKPSSLFQYAVSWICQCHPAQSWYCDATVSDANDATAVVFHKCANIWRLFYFILKGKWKILLIELSSSPHACRELRTLVVEMVLATDMSCHFQQIKAMKSLLQQPETWVVYFTLVVLKSTQILTVRKSRGTGPFIISDIHTVKSVIFLY